MLAPYRIILLLTSLACGLLWTDRAIAACGANTRTWQANAATTAWNTNNNWNPANRPNAANENALIVSDWYNPLYPGGALTIGCLEIQSGTMTASAAGTLTITGDYFRNLNSGSLTVPGGSTWEVYMQATAAQTFENVDTIPRLRLSNSSSVTLTDGFIISDRFLIDAGTTTVTVEGDLTLQQTTVFTVPSSTTLIIASGVTLQLAGDLTIDGTLQLEPGSTLRMANGRTLTVSATGILDINGTSGNAVTVTALDSSSTFTFTANGTLDAQYVTFSRLTSSGLSLNSTVSRFNNINIYNIPSAGAGITLGAASTLPSPISTIGFFDDGTAGPFTNINATAFTGPARSLTNWSGIGDTANEVDPSGYINWGTEATPVLQIVDMSPGGAPPATIAKGAALTHFATFAFSMSGTAASATDVTSVTFLIDGTNLNSDISAVRVYNDTNGNCVYNAGVDLQIGSDLTPTGTPGTVTLAMSGEINVIDTTQDCLHVFVSTPTTATTGATIGIKINATDDVVNSQDYALSDTSGPPVATGTATITGTAVARWNGGFSTAMTTAGNWTPNAVPSSTIDCEIGNGYQAPIMTAAFSCLNTRFTASGTNNWNNTANIFNVYGALVIENGFTFQNSANGVINIRGSGNQVVTLDGATFPNDITINNTGGGTITFEDSGTISGDLTVTTGNIKIANSANLTVSGNITIATGVTFDIEPGGTLTMGNGSTITVNSGGTLEMVGTASLVASVQAINNASNYTITINNGATIRARYYSLANLGLTGLTINATATIDATNQLQNGTFTYPGINSANLLRLFQEVPGDTLDGMTFDLGGSGRTGVISVFTSTGATGDTLSMTNYSGDATGASFTNATNYLVSWDSETNQLNLTQETTAPASANQGDVVDMGSFGFQQLIPGAFNDTDLTQIRINLTGTGSASDVDSVSLYYDAACSGSGGTLIGSLAFTGSPPRAVFSGITGAVVEADGTTPPLRCINVRFNINALATNAKTVGAEITDSSHVVNSEGYLFNGSAAPPVNLGTTTIVGSTTQWTGATSAVWTVAGNWTSGVPTNSLNCIINNQTNDPIISAGTATCKSMSIGNGLLTISGGSLELYGSLESTGTITASAPVVMRDNGVTPTSQNVDITSNLSTLQFNKTAGGSVNINSSFTVTNAISIAGGQNFTLNLTNGNALTASAGLTVTGAVVDMDDGSELRIASGQTLLVNGGTFRTSGTNDAYPQSLVNKAHITNAGGTGTWSFSTTSGTVDLTGFYIDYLDTNGLNISGTTTLTNLDGGQLRNLPSSAGMRAIQLNTSGSIPATALNFGWNWGPDNSPPTEVTSYSLGYSSGCGSQTIDFDQWFGDFWPFTTATTADKISATNCTILIDKAKSPVSLTQFAATPYNNQVVVTWTTGNEWDHRGFNVYRSLQADNNFVQINDQLITNDLFATNIHGTYAFVDNGAQNGITYYYMLEDISLMGESTLHGPLTATPGGALGSAPPITAGTIVGDNDDDSLGDNNGSNGDVHEIARNIWSVARTKNYGRFKIVVPPHTTSPDSFDANYSQLSIQDYSPTTEPGSPALPARTLMLKVDSDIGSATYAIVDQQVTPFTNLLVAPAPGYTANGSQLIAQWQKNDAVYSTDNFAPAAPIVIRDVVTINGENYLPIQILPVAFNPVQQAIKKYDEITLDLYFNGQVPWQAGGSSSDPWAKEGSIKIGLAQEGIYEVTYDDLAAAGVSAPLADLPIEKLRLKVADLEIALEVESSNGFFDSGDTLRFYGPHFKVDEDLNSYALLYADGGDGRRATTASGDPGSLPVSTSPNFWAQQEIEENNIALFNEPYTEDTDHFVWRLIYGIAGGSSVPLNTEINLPHLDQTADVLINVLVKSRRTTALNNQHHVEIYANQQAQAVAETSFAGSEPRILQFRIPGSQFVAGRNRLRIKATGQHLLAGEYDMLYIDQIHTYYRQQWLTSRNHEVIVDQRPGYSYLLDGFATNQLLVYDFSDPSSLVKLNGPTIGATARGHRIHFGLDGSTPGRRLWVGAESALLKPVSYQLTFGSDLANGNNEADVLYIGHPEMLSAINKLATFREQQGYKTYKVSLDDIYNEFGKGLANVDSIKEFLTYVREHWQRKPKYIILLGDGTYDPKGFANDLLPYRFPVKFLMGSSFDYGTDNWFVSNEQDIPQEVIARIPARTPSALLAYGQKVINYELNVAAPMPLSPLSFFSDTPQFQGEDFVTPVTQLNSMKLTSDVQNSFAHTQRSLLNNQQFKNSILAAFDNSSLIHYMGHGAEDMWADIGIFETSDVTTLANQRLPVVVTMNCLNGHFYDPDIESLGEALVLNPVGGAISFWGSTSFTPPTLQAVYQQAFYESLFIAEIEGLGDLSVMAKTQAGLASPHSEILQSWTILGDPMVQIKIDRPPPTTPNQPPSGSPPTTTQPPAAPAPPVAEVEPSSAGGCAAFAADGHGPTMGSRWGAFIGFLLEVLLLLALLKICRTATKTS